MAALCGAGEPLWLRTRQQACTASWPHSVVILGWAAGLLLKHPSVRGGQGGEQNRHIQVGAFCQAGVNYNAFSFDRGDDLRGNTWAQSKSAHLVAAQ